MQNSPSYYPDRRQHPRYRVNGYIVLKDNARTYSAQPLDLSLGGVLFLMNDAPPDGTELSAEIDVVGFRDTIALRMRKIRTYRNLSAAMFLDKPRSLERCIEWLRSREPLAEPEPAAEIAVEV